MYKRPNVFNILTRNGITQGLIGMFLVALVSLVLPDSMEDLWKTIISLVILFSVIGLGIVWFLRSEGFVASQLGLIRMPFDMSALDKYVEERNFSKLGTAVLPRQILQDEITKWVGIDNKGIGNGSASRICIVCGEKSIGRRALACAGFWKKAHMYRIESRLRVYDCTAPDSGKKPQLEFSTADEWEMELQLLIRSFSKKKRYLIILSDFRPGSWLDAVRHLVAYANDYRRHVLFWVKMASDVKEHEIAASESNAVDEIVRSVAPLTIVQSGQFVREYAKQAHLVDKFKRLRERFDEVDCEKSFDRWCFICSGGRPGRLIAFLENEGRSAATAATCLVRDLGSIGFDAGARGDLVPFLWGLCLEKEHVKRLDPNGQVAVQHVAKRIYSDSWEVRFSNVCQLTSILWKDSLGPKMSVSELDELFASASVWIPEEMLVAALGSGNGKNFRTGVVSWIRSVIEEGASLAYVEELCDAIAGALQCDGCYASANGDEIRAAFSEINELEKTLGTFVGVPNAAVLNMDADAFFRALQTGLRDRILAACIDGLGFLEDESVVGIVSILLDTCDDEREFLSYYHSVLPLFALTICNLAELEGIEKMRTIVVREIMSDNHDIKLWKSLLPDFLCTALLCVFRSPHMTEPDRKRLLDSDSGFVGLLGKIPARMCETATDWRNLLDALSNKDTQKMSRHMLAIMEKVPKARQWDGMYVMFSLVVTYINDLYGEVEDSALLRVLDGLGECHFQFDKRDIIRNLASFPVSWRREYVNYAGGELCPDEISVKMDSARRHLKDLESMSKMDVLRYLPDLVRYFSQCVQVKSRGDKQYVGILHAGWQKIQEIAEREDWFNAINRRARYWVVDWSQRIIRDAMSEEELVRFFSRLEELCSEISSTDNVWYHIKLLDTCKHLAQDFLSLGHVLVPVESLVLDRYPRMIPQVNGEIVYQAWYECVIEWFHDNLGVLPSKRSGFDVLTKIAGVMLANSVDRTPECVCDFIDKSYRVPASLEGAHANMKWLDHVLCDFSIDNWNRYCNNEQEEDSKILIERLGASEVFRRAITDRMTFAIEKEDVDDVKWLAKASSNIFMENASPSDLQQDSFCLMLTELMRSCYFLLAKRICVEKAIESFGHLRANLPLENPWAQKFKEMCQKCAEVYEAKLQDYFSQKAVDAASESDWLAYLWAIPVEIIETFSDGICKGIFDRLHAIQTIYSSEWLENLSADWFYATYVAFSWLSLSCCPEAIFSVIEESVLDGEFGRRCMALKYHPEMMPQFLQKILEERKRRSGGILDGSTIEQYRVFWLQMKNRFGWNRFDVDLSADILGWIKYFENALSA